MTIIKKDKGVALLSFLFIRSMFITNRTLKFINKYIQHTILCLIVLHNNCLYVLGTCNVLIYKGFWHITITKNG